MAQELGRFLGESCGTVPTLATSDITRMLGTLSDGDHDAAAELPPLVYDELRMLAGGASGGSAAGTYPSGYRDDTAPAHSESFGILRSHRFY